MTLRVINASGFEVTQDEYDALMRSVGRLGFEIERLEKKIEQLKEEKCQAYSDGHSDGAEAALSDL